MENLVWLFFFGLGVLMLRQLTSIARSLQSTEAMMKRLLSYEGVEWEAEVEPSERVKALASNKRTRIAAIKAYREQSGLGLREAKAVVDEIWRQHQGVA